MLRSDLCDYCDEYIVVKGSINVRVTANINIEQKHIAFKDDASFKSCITKIDSILIDNAENLDIVMSMYNLLEYSQNYSRKLGSLWKSLKFKIKIIGKIKAKPA